jgi:alkylation response protein AidB-like acyl-CoA dehydrogenase
MDFGFSEEQEMLRTSARRFLAAECPTTLVRRMMADTTGHDPELWRKLVELGWTGLVIPEEQGGQGGSFLDLVVVLEEMGRALVPGPFFAAALGGTIPMVEGGSAAQRSALLPRIARGELVASLAVAEADGSFDADGVQLRARPDAARSGGFILGGEKHFVPDAHVADLLIVAARSGGTGERGITLCLVDARAPGVAVRPLRTADMTRRVCRVALEDVHVAPDRIIGAAGEGWPILRRTLDLAITGLAAEMVGTAQQALDRAVAYAKERVQFGRPIGSFQAIKHKCVDMMMGVENARSLAYYAAWAVSERAPEAPQAVAMAKAYASDVVKQVTSEAIQVHGGIGFTWEHDMHLFHRRGLAQEAAFGSAPAHREEVARALGL